MPPPFETILKVDAPTALTISAPTWRTSAFAIVIHADGIMPFAQVILWNNGQQLTVVRAQRTLTQSAFEYRVEIPAGLLGAGSFQIQAEGCRRPDIAQARAEDWVKTFCTLDVELQRPERTRADGSDRIAGGISNQVRVYFGIHKHMHQPYYRATDEGYWDGSIDSIFATRRGPYTDYLVDAVERYLDGELPHAGLSASYSGSLIEQLDRCDRERLAGAGNSTWRSRLAQATRYRTSLGHPRIDHVAFGYFHPLMPLVPHRDIVRQITEHRRLVGETFGESASTVMFPPETAFHVRMIPALLEAGVSAVMYDSIHRFRACKNYPYAGISEGMLPPNLADQRNPAVQDWLQLQNVWAGSLISPSLLRPAYISYTDADEREHRIVGVPAERYLGNEDARGGFGALQYPSVLGQLYDRIVETGTFDPKYPPFFVLHSDGDNYGGGADSYYRHNTERLVEWLLQDSRFELTTVLDYLDRFPPDPADTIHVEAGAWSGADNGDPQFMKWFSMWDQQYSPDLNSWAVLTALQNLVHCAEDAQNNGNASMGGSAIVAQCQRLLLKAETSCYWYWTGQELWDEQVTLAANRVTSILASALDRLVQRDGLGPTIFPPWSAPTNPGGKAWGQGRLIDAPRQARVYTFIGDISGVSSAHVVLRGARQEHRIPLTDLGPYPTRTGAMRTAHQYSALLPEGLGDACYFVEAMDGRGNRSRGSVERIYLP